MIPTTAQIGHDQIGIVGHDLGITGHTLLGMGGHDGSEYAAELLANCYRNALAIAREQGFSSIAFPAISTGVYGYPAREAAQVVSRSLSALLADGQKPSDVRLVFFDAAQAEAFVAAAEFTGGVRRPG